MVSQTSMDGGESTVNGEDGKLFVNVPLSGKSYVITELFPCHCLESI